MTAAIEGRDARDPRPDALRPVEAAMTHFLLGFLCGVAATLYAISRSMSTPETTVPAWVHDEEALPPFDPHLWRERMR